VSACGFPIILTLDEKTTKIDVIEVIKQVGGGDEVWFSPGDGRFYVTLTDLTISAGVQSLVVINAQTSEWLQNVPDVRGKNPAALADNNHILPSFKSMQQLRRARHLMTAFASRNLT